MTPRWSDEAHSAVQRLAQGVGKAFLVVGCLGFVPGVTANLDQLHLTGPGSPTVLLGLVPVTLAGNLLHLGLAAAALVGATSDARARAYLAIGGALYATLCARSMVIGTGEPGATPGVALGLWIPLVAGLGMMTVGWLATSTPAVRHLRRRGFPPSGVST